MHPFIHSLYALTESNPRPYHHTAGIPHHLDPTLHAYRTTFRRFNERWSRRLGRQHSGEGRQAVITPRIPFPSIATIGTITTLMMTLIMTLIMTLTMRKSTIWVVVAQRISHHAAQRFVKEGPQPAPMEGRQWEGAGMGVGVGNNRSTTTMSILKSTIATTSCTIATLQNIVKLMEMAVRWGHRVTDKGELAMATRMAMAMAMAMVMGVDFHRWRAEPSRAEPSRAYSLALPTASPRLAA